MWCFEQQRTERKPQTQQVRSVCVNGWEKVRWGSTAKFVENMNQTWFFAVLALTYLYKHIFCLPMLVITLISKLPTRLSFVNPSSTYPGFLKALKKHHSYPVARLPLLSPSSPAAAPSSVFRCWQKTIWDRVSFHFTHLLHQWEWLSPPHTHTHPTRPAHPLIYCQHGGLSWQGPSSDVFSLMCMTLLSVKLLFTINKTGLSMFKYRKWVSERVKYQ